MQIYISMNIIKFKYKNLPFNYNKNFILRVKIFHKRVNIFVISITMVLEEFWKLITRGETGEGYFFFFQIGEIKTINEEQRSTNPRCKKRP